MELLEPVSYTHLDVYKRQIIDRVTKHGNAIGARGTKSGIVKLDRLNALGAYSLHCATSELDDATLGTCLLYTSRCV